jgi:hypothetical protein
MLLRYRLRFDLRRSELVIIAAGIALAVLALFA